MLYDAHFSFMTCEVCGCSFPAYYDKIRKNLSEGRHKS